MSLNRPILGLSKICKQDFFFLLSILTTCGAVVIRNVEILANGISMCLYDKLLHIGGGVMLN